MCFLILVYLSLVLAMLKKDGLPSWLYGQDIQYDFSKLTLSEFAQHLAVLLLPTLTFLLSSSCLTTFLMTTNFLRHVVTCSCH